MVGASILMPPFKARLDRTRWHGKRSISGGQHASIPPRAAIRDVPCAAIGDIPRAPIGNVPSTGVDDIPRAAVGDVPRAAVGDVPRAAIGDRPCMAIRDIPARRSVASSLKALFTTARHHGGLPATGRGGA